MKDFLYMLLRTLNTIHVCGKDDIASLWGCINAVEQKIADLENPTTEEVSDDG